MKQFTKDPRAVLDYVFDLKPKTRSRAGAKTDWLQTGETVTEHAVTVKGSVSVDSSAESDGAITVWLSGGDAGKSIVTCEFTTSLGRTDRRSMVIQVEER